MAAIAMGIMAGASTLFGSLMGGQEQKSQNAIQRAQFEEQEFQRQMQNQIQNRQIANVNAAKWMANKNIASAVNKARAEEEFWLEYNFDNASKNFSRQFGKATEQIKSAFTARNVSMNSGSSKALMRQALISGQQSLTDQRIQKSTGYINIKRKQDAGLAQRDFGYNDQIKFTKGQLLQQSDSSIMINALTSGVVTGALSGASTYMSFQQGQASTNAAEAAAAAAEQLAAARMQP